MKSLNFILYCLLSNFLIEIKYNPLIIILKIKVLKIPNVVYVRNIKITIRKSTMYNSQKISDNLAP